MKRKKNDISVKHTLLFIIGFSVYALIVNILILVGVIVTIFAIFSGLEIIESIQLIGIGLLLITLGILPTAILSKKILGKRQYFVFGRTLFY